MKARINKIKVESWFAKVDFYVIKGREVKFVFSAAIEIPSYDSLKKPLNVFPDTLWPELFRYHAREFSKIHHTQYLYSFNGLYVSVDEVETDDNGLVQCLMPESFLRKHHLFVVSK